jgi:hypothetical protein
MVLTIHSRRRGIAPVTIPQSGFLFKAHWPRASIPSLGRQPTGTLCSGRSNTLQHTAETNEVRELCSGVEGAYYEGPCHPAAPSDEDAAG